MELFVVGLIVGSAVVFAFGAPLLASWPTRLRYLLASQTPDPVLGLMPWPRLEMSEVTVVHVTAGRDAVEVTLAEAMSRSRTRHRSLVTTSSTPGTVAQLEGWCAARVPLLLIVDENGAAQLCGPHASVAGFRALSERV